MTLYSPFPATASGPESAVWCFGEFVLDVPRYELSRNGAPIRVEPQVFDVLTHLVKHHCRVVTKNELFDAVWGGRFVGEAALTSRIKAARRALGDDGEMQHYIRTVRGRGYRFVGTFVDPNADHAERTAVADDLGSEMVLTRRFVAQSGGGLRFHAGRSRSYGRLRYSIAPSTRRREFNGPPK